MPNSRPVEVEKKPSDELKFDMMPTTKKNIKKGNFGDDSNVSETVKLRRIIDKQPKAKNEMVKEEPMPRNTGEILQNGRKKIGNGC